MEYTLIPCPSSYLPGLHPLISQDHAPLPLIQLPGWTHQQSSPSALVYKHSYSDWCVFDELTGKSAKTISTRRSMYFPRDILEAALQSR